MFLADNPIFLWVAILMLTFTFGLIFIVNAIKQGLKKVKVARGLNKFLTITACFVLSFAITGGVAAITIGINRAGFLDRDPSAYTQAPLTLSDLIDIEKDQYMTENSINQTALVGQQRIHQRKPFDAEGTSTAPDLRYTITFVKVPFLYNWCKEEMYYDQDETYSDWPVGNRMLYKQQDADPWGAKEVYRLYSEEG